MPMKRFLLLTALIAVTCTFMPLAANQVFPEGFWQVGTTYLQIPEDPEKKVEVYPNPLTDGVLTLKTEEQMLSVQILNITGKIVFNAEYQIGTYSAVLELSKLEKGIYLIRISFSDKEVHTEKLMVK